MPAAKPRIGLVLGGGGARGAFSVGVINYLQAEQGIRDFPVISGTSTGALLGTLACTKQFAKLSKIYTTAKPGDIINPHNSLIASTLGIPAALFASVIFGGKGVFDTTALRLMIENNVDFDRVKERAPDSLLIYNTVDLITGELRTFDNRRHSKKVLASALVASASEPVFMDPVEIDVAGESLQLVDGGVRELVPLGAAFESGVDVDAFVVIATNPLTPKALPAAADGILGVLERSMELMLVEGGTNDLKLGQTINALLRVVENARGAGIADDELLAGLDDSIRKELGGKRSVPIIVVAPKERIDVESLDFDPATLQSMFDLGLARATEVLDPIFENWPPAIIDIGDMT